MQIQTGPKVALQACPSEHAYDTAIQQDLEFLRAWEDGHFPDVCCYLRVRQIRNGNPILVAERRLRKVDVQKTRPSM